MIDGGTLNFGSSLAVDKLYVGYASGRTGTLTLSSGQTVIVGAGGAGTEGLEVGEAGGSAGTLNVGPGATLTVSAWSRVGNGGAATVNQTGGTVSFNGGFALSDNGGLSTYNMSGGTLNAAQITVAMRGTGNLNVSGTTAGTVLNLSSLYVGSRTTPNNNSVGTVNQDGGTVNANGTVYMGYSSGTTGVYNLNGGVLNVATQITDGAGTSTLNVEGGTLNLSGTGITVDIFRIGNAAGRNGSFTLAGGKTLATGELMIGNNGTASGTLTIEPGATLTVTGPVTIGQTGAATVNQNGGDVTFSLYGNLANYGNTSTYNLNGGTLTTTSSYLTIGQRGTAYLNVSGTALLTTNSDFNLGGFITSSGAGTAVFNFTGGTLHAGNVQFALTNQGGTLAPGQPIGTTLVNGTGAGYDQLAPGVLEIELGGRTAGTEYDVLDVAGPVNLAGALDVFLVGGFLPVTGDTFDVVTGTDITLDPAFSLDQPAGLTPGNFFVMNVISGGPRGEILQLTLGVPEPATLLLLALGAAAVLASMGRRSRRCPNR